MRPATIGLPKRCIFCQNRTRLTKEDFFPEWFRELYPAPEEGRNARLNAEVSWYERDESTGEPIFVVAPGKLARPGDLADQTLRVVCAACNNGWMSRLQQVAKPHLMPYIEGKWRSPSPTARRIISSWATMFAMVVEFADEPRAVVPPIERLLFMRDLQPPIGANVLAARLAGDIPYWFHQRAWRLTLDADEIASRPNARLTTITLGHLLLQVYLTTTDLVAFDPVERCVEHGLLPLWPLDLKVRGHRQLPIRDKDAARDFAYRQLREDVLPGVLTQFQRDDSGLLGGGRD